MTHVPGDELRGLGFDPRGLVAHNLSVPRLYEEAVRRRECELGEDGQIIARTGKHTGRSAKDKFVVQDESNEDSFWWGEVNQPMDRASFEAVRELVVEHYGQNDLFVFDGYAGADTEHRMRVRVVTTTAWHNLFARNMLIPEDDPEVLKDFVPEFTVYHAPECLADPEKHGTRSETFVLVDFDKNEALIGGSFYAGEIKKTVFTVMNRRLPEKGILSMHCSANYGNDRDDVALFFGLSGTGKTTLSTDDQRTLIGDDEHGWGPEGVFNIEGGCYAKVIDLSAEGEPQIWDASHKFGSILENVVYDEATRRIDWTDGLYTENTRSSYAVTALDNMDPGGVAGHPKNVVFLTADAFGVLPPIARLTKEQAMYHFLSGYTAKVAGTEMGVTEPTATFSACFGAPFLPLPPGVYAELFGKLVDEYGPTLWLVNTGWTGGPYGVGTRMRLDHTRRMVRAALSGELDAMESATDPVFGLEVPRDIEGVPSVVLNPRDNWDDGAAFDTMASKLARMFVQNFEQFADQVDDRVVAAGPKVQV